MPASELEITAIPAFTDNYIWLLSAGGSACVVVDPGDHRPVLGVLARRGLDLRHILLTHHHADHTGGVAELLRHHRARVWGPADPRIRELTDPVGAGDRVSLAEPALDFEVLFVPGHTSSHIAYHGAGSLFCGDTLFSMGCGRLFEGTPEQMQASLDQFAALPPATRVYCAHEYTRSNCAFALAVEPANRALNQYAESVEQARRARRATLPSTIGQELAANPFMRTREESVVAAARRRVPSAGPGAPTLAVIRAWKDGFQT
jgi:hydroxyacylglutathione hydrolase